MAVFKTFKELADHLARQGAAVTHAAVVETDHFADLIVDRAQANTPVLSGTLRDSVHKEVVTGRAGETVRDVVADAPYAAAVHERPPDMDHAHENEGTPEGFPGRHFLTRPVRFHRDEFASGLRNGVGEAMRSGNR